MTEARLYFDHNATAPLRPEARAAMLEVLDRVGNASSVHGEGRAARRLVEDAREQVAALVGCSPAEVVFTSGATEANNQVLRSGWDVIYRAGIEHDSVLSPAAANGAKVVELGVHRDGIVDLGELAYRILTSHGDSRALLSLQMANNETGVIQDVAAAAEFCRSHSVHTHTDAVQAAGRKVIDFVRLDVDFLTLSSHKIGGPMGAGALIVRDGIDLAPLIQGGGQERRRRSGTENVAAIAGFGAAAAAAHAELPRQAALGEMRDRLLAGIRQSTPDAFLIAEGADRLANTIALALPGQQAETLVIKLDLAGVAVSAGAACSSGKVGASHVLDAMGLAPEIGRSAIRISLGWNTTEKCLEAFLTRWQALHAAAATNHRAVA